MALTRVYHDPRDRVADILIQYGAPLEIIDRYLRSVPRDVASNFTGEYIGGIGRIVIEDEIQREVTAALATYSIVVDDILVRDVDLPDTVDIRDRGEACGPAEGRHRGARATGDRDPGDGGGGPDPPRGGGDPERDGPQGERDRSGYATDHRDAEVRGSEPSERNVGLPDRPVYPGPLRPELEHLLCDHHGRGRPDHHPAEALTWTASPRRSSTISRAFIFATPTARTVPPWTTATSDPTRTSAVAPVTPTAKTFPCGTKSSMSTQLTRAFARASPPAKAREIFPRSVTAPSCFPPRKIRTNGQRPRVEAPSRRASPASWNWNRAREATSSSRRVPAWAAGADARARA